MSFGDFRAMSEGIWAEGIAPKGRITAQSDLSKFVPPSESDTLYQFLVSDKSFIATALIRADLCKSLLTRDQVLTPEESFLLHQDFDLANDFEVGFSSRRVKAMTGDMFHEQERRSAQRVAALKGKPDFTTYIWDVVYNNDGKIFSLDITYVLDGKMWNRLYSTQGIIQERFDKWGVPLGDVIQ